MSQRARRVRAEGSCTSSLLTFSAGRSASLRTFGRRTEMRGPFNFEGGKMAFRASDFHFYYQLKPCSLRVYLRQQHVAEKEPDVYQHLLIRLGEFHEKRHLRSLGEYFDAGGSESKTRDAVYSKA